MQEPRFLDAAGIPSFRFPEAAVRAISYYATRPASRTKVRTRRPSPEAERLVSGKKYLRDSEGMRLMELYGLTTPNYGVVTSAEEALKVSKEIGYPVVMKISPDEPVHKTELKGVVVNVASDEQVTSVFSDLSKITPLVMIQKQVNGLEVFLGALDDPTFGQTVLASAGGIYVEVIGRTSHRLAPVAEDEAQEMLRESRVHDMLNARKRGYDEEALTKALLSLSRLSVDLGIKAIDLNPVIVNAEGAFVVDVRATFG